MGILHVPVWLTLFTLFYRLLARGEFYHVPGWFMLFILFSRLLARGEFYLHLFGLCCFICSLGCWLGGEFYLIGQRWSPVIEPYGLMICVKCQCASVRMFITYFTWFK